MIGSLLGSCITLTCAVSSAAEAHYRALHDYEANDYGLHIYELHDYVGAQVFPLCRQSARIAAEFRVSRPLRSKVAANRDTFAIE